jgi:tryptophan synthase beta subunit
MAHLPDILASTHDRLAEAVRCRLLLQREELARTGAHRIDLGVAPEHAHLKDPGRAEYVVVPDAEALDGFRTPARPEGIVPALEAAHAAAWLLAFAGRRRGGDVIVLSVSGRGDKDGAHVAALAGGRA